MRSLYCLSVVGMPAWSTSTPMRRVSTADLYKKNGPGDFTGPSETSSLLLIFAGELVAVVFDFGISAQLLVPLLELHLFFVVQRRCHD